MDERLDWGEVDNSVEEVVDTRPGPVAEGAVVAQPIGRVGMVFEGCTFDLVFGFQADVAVGIEVEDKMVVAIDQEGKAIESLWSEVERRESIEV